MFWGTDITRTHCSRRQCVTMFTERLARSKGRDLDLVMGEAVCNWLGWRLNDGLAARGGAFKSSRRRLAPRGNRSTRVTLAPGAGSASITQIGRSKHSAWAIFSL
jgi:hypothetical protein